MTSQRRDGPQTLWQLLKHGHDFSGRESKCSRCGLSSEKYEASEMKLSRLACQNSMIVYDASSNTFRVESKRDQSAQP